MSRPVVYKVGPMALLILLAGCAPQATMLYYKQGMVFSKNQRDYDACKIKSFKDIPQNMVTEYKPGVYSPGTVSCYNIGYSTQCNTVGAVNIPPSSYTYDTNLELRMRFVRDCMSEKGYSLVEVLNCKEGEAGYNSLTKAPSLEKIKCFDSNSPRLDL